MKYLQHPIVKIAITVLVLWLLWRSNLLSWEDFQGDKDWKWYIFSIIFIPLLPLLEAYRSQVLFASQKIHLPIKKLFSWNMIAIFLSSALPTSAASELVRFGYISSAVEKHNRMKVAGTILVNRVLGLASLFILPAVIGLIFWNKISHIPQIVVLVLLSCFIALFCICGGIFAGSRFFHGNITFLNIMKKIPLGTLIYNTAGYFRQVNLAKGTWVKVILAATFGNILMCIQWICYIYLFNQQVDILLVFIVIPLIPLFMLFGFAGGIGIGTAGGAFILSEFLGVQGAAGIVLFLQAIGLPLAVLIGLPFYLKEGSANVKKKLKQEQENLEAKN